MNTPAGAVQVENVEPVRQLLSGGLELLAVLEAADQALIPADVREQARWYRGLVEEWVELT